MKLRVARHTVDLKPIINFYTTVLGLEIIGEFKDHNNYDGVFIGGKSGNWHLEFTISNEQPNHQPDDDDLLVLYAETVIEYEKIKRNIITHHIPYIDAKNPYWKENGITIADPDGFRIVIALSGV